MSEGAIEAGRLEVPVDSNTNGFGRRLKAAIERQTKGLEVEVPLAVDENGFKEKVRAVVESTHGGSVDVGLDVDGEGFGSRLRAKVKEAAAGLMAEIGVDVDADRLRARLKAIAETIGTGLKATIGVEVNDTEVAAARAKIEAAAKDVEVKIHTSNGVIARWLAKIRAAKEKAKNPPVDIGLGVGGTKGPRYDERGDSGGPSRLGRMWAAIQKTKDGRGPAWMQRASQVAGMVTKIVSVLSLVSPAITAIGGAIGGVVAMLGSLGQMVGMVATLPGLLTGVISAFGTLLIAFSGFTGELGDMTPEMRSAARAVRSFKDEWNSLRTSVQNAFWKDLDEPIRETGKVLLPMLETGLSRVAQELNGVARKFMEWVRSDEFKTQFPRVMESSAVVTGLLGSALVNLLDWMLDVMAVAAPFTERMTKAFTGWTEKLANHLDDTANRDKFTAWMERAYDVGAQAGRIIGDLGTAIAGIFRAGDSTGQSLLDKLEQKTQALTNWVNSDDGAARIEEWFRKAEPIAEAVGGLVGDIVEALLRMAENPNVVRLINQIRDDLVPALEKFLTTVGDELGDKVITFFTNLVEVLSQLAASSGGALGELLDTLNSGLEWLSTTLENNPGMADTLGKIGGALLAWNLLKPLVANKGVLTLLGAALAGIAGSIEAIKKNKGVTLPGGLTGAGTTGKGGGFGNTVKNLLGFSTEVYWNRPMPVFVTNPGSLGTGAGGAPGSKPKPGAGTNGKPKRTFGGGKAGIIGGIAALLGLGALSQTDTSSWGGNSGQIANGAVGGLGIGSMFGPWGMLIGTILGGGIGTANAGVQNAKDKNTTKEDQLKTLMRMAATSLIGGPGLLGLGLSFGQSLIPQETWDSTVEDAKAGFLRLHGVGVSGMQGFTVSVRDGVATASSALGVFSRDAEGNVDVDLSSTGRRVVDKLANALPAPIGNALRNLSIFKRDAPNTVSVDLSGKAKEIGDKFANALPEPVQKALTNLGVFKQNADGSVRVDLTGPAKAVGDTLANALPAPVRTALTNLGVFKRDAAGAASVNLSGTGSEAGRTLADSIPGRVSTALSNLGLFKRDAPGRTSVDLADTGRGVTNSLQRFLPAGVQTALSLLRAFQSQAPGMTDVSLWSVGSRIIASLKNGIAAGYDAIRRSLQWLTNMIPSWKGPAERDATLLEGAGRLIMRGFRSAVEGEYGGIRSSLMAFTNDLAGTSASWSGTYEAELRTSRSGLRDAFGDGRGGTRFVFEDGAIRISNPVPERASTSLAGALREAAAVVGTNED